MAAPLGWNPTLQQFADVLKRPPFNVRVTEHPGACGTPLRQAFFIRRDEKGQLRTAVHPAVWHMVLDPILLTDLLDRLGIDPADYANAINEDADADP